MTDLTAAALFFKLVHHVIRLPRHFDRTRGLSWLFCDPFGRGLTRLLYRVNALR